MKRKWLISPENEMSPEERETYWTAEHADDNFHKTVWGVTGDGNFLEKIVCELNSVPRRKSILIPGCGSKNTLQNHIAENVRGVEKIVCSDFKKIVEIARRKNNSEIISYEVKDSARLGYSGEFDIVLIVNSLVSESDAENRDIVRSCGEATVPGGILMAVVPTICAALEIAILDKSKQNWLDSINLERFSLYEQNQKVWQIFYPPLLLKRIMKEAGFKTRKMEICFFDSPYIREHTKEHYGIEDPDVCVYELFVVGEKV